MIELVQYDNKQHERIMLQYYSKNDLSRDTNKGKYCLLSLLGVYHSDYYILEDNHALIGCVLIRRKISLKYPNSSWIYDVFILPDYRGKGYGKALMRLAIVKCSKKKILIYVRDDNTSAINLYIRAGFREIAMDNGHKLLQYDKV